MKRFAYKLLRVRRDGSIGPLFINRQQIIPIGKWLRAESHPTKGFQVRSGWHVTGKPCAPHLSIKNRRWYLVEIKSFKSIKRPESQGGEWFLCDQMKVLTEYRGPSINYENKND